MVYVLLSNYFVAAIVLGPENTAGNNKQNKEILIKLYNILYKCYIEE